jgi:hypothetical protein
MLPAYSLAEIFAEKLRTIYQRSRGRDYYDLYQIFPAPGDTLIVIDRQVSGGHRLRMGNGILLLKRLVLYDEFVNPLSEFFGTIFACQ